MLATHNHLSKTVEIVTFWTCAPLPRVCFWNIWNLWNWRWFVTGRGVWSSRPAPTVLHTSLSFERGRQTKSMIAPPSRDQGGAWCPCWRLPHSIDKTNHLGWTTSNMDFPVIQTSISWSMMKPFIDRKWINSLIKMYSFIYQKWIHLLTEMHSFIDPKLNYSLIKNDTIYTSK